MKQLLILSVITLLFIGCATTDQKISLKTRNNVTQDFYLSENKNASACVILFTGGKGKVDNINKANNFLIRSRNLFLKEGFNVIVVNAPSDKQSSDGMLYGFRDSDEHVKDIDKIISYLKNTYHLPVWLIGTSRGTESAASIAIKSKQKLSGLILTSSMSVENEKGTSLTEMDLENIKIPTLIVANNDDACYVTPPEGAKKIASLLTNAKPLDIKMFNGGAKPISKPCQAQSYHGFLGIEDKVVKYIANFIKSN